VGDQPDFSHHSYHTEKGEPQGLTIYLTQFAVPVSRVLYATFEEREEDQNKPICHLDHRVADLYLFPGGFRDNQVLGGYYKRDPQDKNKRIEALEIVFQVLWSV
jgi:hypothetical protein